MEGFGGVPSEPFLLHQATIFPVYKPCACTMEWFSIGLYGNFEYSLVQTVSLLHFLLTFKILSDFKAVMVCRFYEWTERESVLAWPSFRVSQCCIKCKYYILPRRTQHRAHIITPMNRMKNIWYTHKACKLVLWHICTMSMVHSCTYYYNILQPILHQTHVVRSIQMNSDGDYLLQNHILS